MGKAGRGLLAPGDPDFDADLLARRATAPSPVAIAVYRSATPDCLNLEKETWRGLPETKREVREVRLRPYRGRREPAASFGARACRRERRRISGR